MKISFQLNGAPREIECAPGASLFEVLRKLGCLSVKQGCDREGTCGACTVLLDGKAILSCITPAARASGRSVSTVESLGHPGKPHTLQRAFVDAGAVQCGFCTPGMILSAKALLDHTPEPTEAQIVEALSGSLCRCTGYVKIVDAVRNAAVAMKKEL